MPEQHITLRAFVSRLNKSGRQCTLLGVGPVSEVAVRATFLACVKYDCPPIFIASRNQVDLKELGHGYLMGGMDQAAFGDLLRRVGAETGYKGNVYICRDHGGPWQRNAELDQKYPVERAMAIAEQSFRADIEAGFNYLHIDPTKCPFPFTQEQLVEWTVDLVAYCESVRRSLATKLGKGEIDYEVGTEDIQGGLTTADTYESFLKLLTARLMERGLPLPTCVVGQTGTLCKIDRNVGHFDAEATSRLVKIAAGYGVGFKEHNGDYMSAASCRIHPQLGVTGMNVAPEFGLIETDTLLALADLEEKLVHEGWLKKGQASGLREMIVEKAFAAPWKKWMTDDVKKLATEHIKGDKFLRILIARVCGHYTYDDEQVKAARARLYANLDGHAMVEPPAGCAAALVLEKVQAAIEFYLRHFAVQGINR
jgi:tagatose-1,6-bisphosphate aldolase non-catalytic subunit AgaZ/GatZ